LVALVRTPFFLALNTDLSMSAHPVSPERPARPVDHEGLPVLRVGFMPLVDCAPLVMASQLGFDRRHGVSLQLQRVMSWAAMRDKLLHGELDLAQLLYGLVYGVHQGITGPRTPMAVLMTLNRNGQGISLSRRLVDQGAFNLSTLADLVRRQERQLSFAQTFPGGTHAMWLNYWLASAGIHPQDDVRTVVVPPPRMVDSVRGGLVDGFSVGEPWNQKALAEGICVHAAASQDVWPDHPEKVLGCTAAFVHDQPELALAATAAVLEACRWLDASTSNREQAAEVLTLRTVVNAPVHCIVDRLCGRYQDGMGRRWQDPHRASFYGDGEVNHPWLSDGMWFLTQHKRWGLLDQHPDYEAVASAINRLDLYRGAAAAIGAHAPTDTLRSSRLIDGVVWNGQDPRAYADHFSLHARPAHSLAA
jgi:nitrate/nitrite transport system substrate-binding protein